MKNLKKKVFGLFIVFATMMLMSITANAAVKTSVNVHKYGQKDVYVTWNGQGYSKAASSNTKIIKTSREGKYLKLQFVGSGLATVKYYNSKGTLVRSDEYVVFNKKTIGSMPKLLFGKHDYGTIDSYISFNDMSASNSKTLLSKLTKTYSTSNKNVISVDKKGNYLTKSAGTATISVSLKYKGVALGTLSTKVTVQDVYTWKNFKSISVDFNKTKNYETLSNSDFKVIITYQDNSTVVDTDFTITLGKSSDYVQYFTLNGKKWTYNGAVFKKKGVTIKVI
jgi:hypothetical protein